MDLSDIVITEIKNVFTVSSPKGRYDKMVNRECYGLSFSINGQITYTHNDKSYISNPHHAIILPKGQSYTIHGDRDGIFPVINFDCATPLCDTLVTIPIDNVDPYIKEYEQIKSLLLFSGNRAKTMSIFYNILHKLASETAPSSNLLSPAIKYLEKNFSVSNITNTHLAKLCDISEVYFRKQFFEIFKLMLSRKCTKKKNIDSFFKSETFFIHKSGNYIFYINASVIEFTVTVNSLSVNNL